MIYLFFLPLNRELYIFLRIVSRDSKIVNPGLVVLLHFESGHLNCIFDMAETAAFSYFRSDVVLVEAEALSTLVSSSSFFSFSLLGKCGSNRRLSCALISRNERAPECRRM